MEQSWQPPTLTPYVTQVCCYPGMGSSPMSRVVLKFMEALRVQSATSSCVVSISIRQNACGVCEYIARTELDLETVCAIAASVKRQYPDFIARVRSVKLRSPGTTNEYIPTL